MSIYTRRGDEGETSLADGSRVSKAHERVEAYGAIDEANCIVGLARSSNSDPQLEAILAFVQHRLFNCSSSLAHPMPSDSAPASVTYEDVQALEAWIDHFDSQSGRLTGFVLPSGTELSARLQCARAVLRRAERRIVPLRSNESVEPAVQAFINRASDLLFAAARHANTLEAEPEEVWDVDAPRPTI
ncbi:MAG TPA: cob(I)yrinic acid a,c-diamide adenosyltransferase [Coriobacteriia bacterium]|nr:cob(I)yrinic acid a,c-diamide adenosyltransferase [Coriobacteriia bacterium]